MRDGWHACCIGVAEVGYLHGGEATGEERQAVHSRVSGEVDEDVGRVTLNESRSGVILHAVEVCPFARQFSQCRARGVLGVVAMVEQRLHARGVEILKQWLEKEGDRVVSQVWRDKADAEFLVGLLRIEKNLGLIFCEKRSKFLVRFENGLLILAW